MTTLKINVALNAPNGTKVISPAHGDFVTLARKMKTGVVFVLTALATDIGGIDLHDDKNWLELSRSEVAALSKL